MALQARAAQQQQAAAGGGAAAGKPGAGRSGNQEDEDEESGLLLGGMNKEVNSDVEDKSVVSLLYPPEVGGEEAPREWLRGRGREGGS